MIKKKENRLVEFLRNCKMYAALLLYSPQEFLFSFTYPKEKKVSLSPYNPKIATIERKIVDKIHREYPELKVNFFGSAGLKIAGERDIDLFIECASRDFRNYYDGLVKMFGKPKKQRRMFIEWKFEQEGNRIELSLIDPSSLQFRNQVEVYTLLKENPEYLEEYEKIKLSLNGSSVQKYQRERMVFFNRILKRKMFFIDPLVRFIKLCSTILVSLFVIAILGLAVRGIPGNPTSAELNDSKWKDDGPFELSPDRGRFALTYSLIEDKSFQFSVDVARFATPDVANLGNGKFASLFAPTLSYIIMPGYVLGKYLGASQVGSFAIICLFAFLNFLLIRALAKKLGAHPIAATIGGLVFVFASPAFPYAVTLYQHHVSVFFILFSIYALLSWRRIIALPIVWFLCALSLSLDNPNLFLMFPIGIYALTKIVSLKRNVTNKAFVLNIRPLYLLTMAVMALPIVFFLYFNKMSYGNPFQLGGTVTSATQIDETGKVDIADIERRRQEQKEQEKKEPHKKEALGFFQTRQLPNGLYTFFFSKDRGIWMYNPIQILGVIGLFVLIKKKPNETRLLLTIIGINILLYSMWGDPYGGWAFGSRYLIPSYALLSILLAVALSRYRRNILFLAIFLGCAVYSVGVNTIGALTSNRNPPYIQILDLESISHNRERYTYMRNIEILNRNSSKSFVFREIAKNYMSAWEYTLWLSGAVSLMIGINLIGLILVKKKDE